MRGEDRIALRSAVGLGALVLATFLAVTTEIVPVGLLPQLVRAYEVPPSVAGLLLTVYAAFVAVLAVPLTLLTVRLPRKPLLLGTLVLYAAGNLLIALAPSFPVVFAGRAVGGIAHALFFSVSTAYAAALVPPRLQGRAIAIALSGASLGYVLGAPLVTGIGASVDQRAAFGVLALGAVLFGLVTAVALPDVPTPPGTVPREIAGPTRGLVLVATANLLGFLGQFSLYTYVSTLLVDRGLPEGALSATLFLIGAAGILGLWLAGLLVDRRPRAGLIGALAVPAVCVTLLGVVPAGLAPTLALVVVWGVAAGAFPTFFATASLRSQVLSPNLSAAVNNSVSNIGIGGGAAVGGLAYAVGGLPAAIGAGVLGFAAALAVVVLSRTGFPSRPQGTDPMRGAA